MTVKFYFIEQYYLTEFEHCDLFKCEQFETKTWCDFRIANYTQNIFSPLLTVQLAMNTLMAVVIAVKITKVTCNILNKNIFTY